MARYELRLIGGLDLWDTETSESVAKDLPTRGKQLSILVAIALTGPGGAFLHDAPYPSRSENPKKLRPPEVPRTLDETRGFSDTGDLSRQTERRLKREAPPEAPFVRVEGQRERAYLGRAYEVDVVELVLALEAYDRVLDGDTSLQAHRQAAFRRLRRDVAWRDQLLQRLESEGEFSGIAGVDAADAYADTWWSHELPVSAYFIAWNEYWMEQRPRAIEMLKELRDGVRSVCTTGALTEARHGDPADEFFGREWAFEKLERWLDDDRRLVPRAIVVRGGSFVGKERLCSEVAARLTSAGSATSWSPFSWTCRRGEDRARSWSGWQLVESLCRHLAGLWGEDFRSRKSGRWIADDISERLEPLLAEARQPVLLIVDGPEASANEYSDASVLRVVERLAALKLPNLRILCATSSSGLLETADVIDLEGDEARADVREYCRRQIEDRERADAIADLAGPRFAVARLCCMFAADAAAQDLQTAFSDLLRDHLTRLGADDTTEKLLAVLSVAGGGTVSKETLLHLLEIDDWGRLDRTLHVVDTLVVEESTTVRLRDDFIAEQLRELFPPRRSHHFVAQRLWHSTWANPVATPGVYAAEFSVRHLLDSIALEHGQPAEWDGEVKSRLAALLADPRWLEARMNLERGNLVWVGVLGDIDAASVALRRVWKQPTALGLSFAELRTALARAPRLLQDARIGGGAWQALHDANVAGADTARARFAEFALEAARAGERDLVLLAGENPFAPSSLRWIVRPSAALGTHISAWGPGALAVGEPAPGLRWLRVDRSTAEVTTLPPADLHLPGGHRSERALPLPGGDLVAVAGGGEAALWSAGAGWLPHAVELDAAVAGLAVLGDGRVLAFTQTGRYALLGAGEAAFTAACEALAGVDALWVAPDAPVIAVRSGREFALLGVAADGAIHEQGERMRFRETMQFNDVAIASAGTAIFAGTSTGLYRLTPDLGARPFGGIDAGVLKVAAGAGWIAAGTREGAVHVVADGADAQAPMVVRHRRAISALRVVPWEGGELLVSADREGFAHAARVGAGAAVTRLGSFRGDPSPVTDVTLASPGELVTLHASREGRATLRGWSLPSAPPAALDQPVGQGEAVLALGWIGDSLVAAGSSALSVDGELRDYQGLPGAVAAAVVAETVVFAVDEDWSAVSAIDLTGALLARARLSARPAVVPRLGVPTQAIVADGPSGFALATADGVLTGTLTGGAITVALRPGPSAFRIARRRPGAFLLGVESARAPGRSANSVVGSEAPGDAQPVPGGSALDDVLVTVAAHAGGRIAFGTRSAVTVADIGDAASAHTLEIGGGAPPQWLCFAGRERLLAGSSNRLRILDAAAAPGHDAVVGQLDVEARIVSVSSEDEDGWLRVAAAETIDAIVSLRMNLQRSDPL